MRYKYIDIMTRKFSILSSIKWLDSLLDKMNGTYAATNTIAGHEYVDMGLSVKWVTCNVGAGSPTATGARCVPWQNNCDVQHYLVKQTL